jgi:hypothetical protein
VHPNSSNLGKGGREPSASGIKMQALVYSLCLLCPCACSPFYRSKLCLAEAVLHFCVFNWWSSGLLFPTSSS